MDLENWKEQLKEDWGLDDVAGVYYKGYSLGHQMDDLESYISKLLSSQLKEVKKLITKTLTVDTTKMDFINDGKTRWERGREGIGIEPCIECSHANNIDKLLAEVEKLV